MKNEKLKIIVMGETNTGPIGSIKEMRENYYTKMLGARPEQVAQSLQDAMRDAYNRRGTIASMLKLGAAVYPALNKYFDEMVQRPFADFADGKPAVSSFLGIEIIQTDTLPPEGFAFIDAMGNVLAVGRLVQDDIMPSGTAGGKLVVDDV